VARGRILVVDDDDDTRKCVAAVLEGEGYAATMARNGREALDALQRGAQPDLVLLDLMMPVMNGWDLLAAMERAPNLAALPVVLFTAAGDPIVQTDVKRPTLRKPIDLDLLLEVVEKVCAAGWLANEPPSDLLPKVPA
jgi:CheY-like chemotaxis protein